MAQNIALGIDLGGTKIYAVATDEDNNILAEAKMSTDAGAGPDKIAGDIIELGRTALKSINVDMKDIEHIGVAVPTPVDPVTGEGLFATNLGWKNFSMRETLSNLSGHNVHLGNDGNLGLLGEYYCGAGKGFKTVIAYYVGTGLGGGIIADGRLHVGNSGLAGEFGHAIIRQGGRRCGCGHRGCAEAYCSKIAFVKALRKAVFKRGMSTCLPPDKFNSNSRNIKSKLLAKAYLSGDPAVCAVVNKGSYMLGVAAASAAAVVAPDCIILGGGVISSLGSEMYPVFKRSFDEHLFGLDPAKIDIRFSLLGDRSVALGASILARKNGDV